MSLVNSAIDAKMPERYQIIVPVWNEKYVQLFINYALPFQLAPGNLPALPPKQTIYQIFTCAKDAEIIRKSWAFCQLAENLRVEMHYIDDLDFSAHPYNMMTICYERAIASAASHDTAFFFLTPDSFWSNGTFAAVMARLREGKRAVVTMGLRACLPEMLTRLDANRHQKTHEPLELDPRELLRLALTYLHPLSLAHFIENNGNHSLGHYYWRVGNHTLVARCFHMHPLMVRPVHPIHCLHTTLDHEYVRQACPNYADVHLVTDSDELCGIEVSEKEHMTDMICPGLVPDGEIHQWMDQWTSSYHRRYFNSPIILHTKDISEEIGPVMAEANRFVNQIMADYTRRNPRPMEAMPILLGSNLFESRNTLGVVYQWLRRKLKGACRRFYRAVNYKLYQRVERLDSGLNEVRSLLKDVARLLQLLRTAVIDKGQSCRDREVASIHSVMEIKEDQLRVDREMADFPSVIKNAMRFLQLLRSTGHFNFNYPKPDDPTFNIPLGYPSWDYANFVYRPVFQQAFNYLNGNRINGHITEFGTYRGFTARLLAEVMQQCQYSGHLYLFDSFEGLPDPEGTIDATSYEGGGEGVWSKGAMGLEPGIEKHIFASLAEVIDSNHLHIIKGFFEDTLDQNLPERKVALIHIDCDLYTSAKLVLEILAKKDLLQDGCVVLFDDFNCNKGNPAMGERAALREFLAQEERWQCSFWFSYGWHGQAFIFHDQEAMPSLRNGLQGPKAA